MHFIFVLIGIVLLGFGIRLELQWRHRVKFWTQTKGVIIKETSSFDRSNRLEIRFRHKGRRVTLGNTVTVIYDPQTLTARHYTFSNRWCGTFTLFYLGLLFTFAGFRELLVP